jgi:thiol-disulfide isomerase/thioredoxin
MRKNLMSYINEENTKKRLWSPFRLSLTLVAVFLTASLGTSSCNSDDVRDRSTKPTVTVRSNQPTSSVAEPLPALPPNVLNAELRSVNGESIRLRSYSGKVLIVNLWATWCGPCRVEIPELVKLQKEYRSKGVEVVGLSTEDPDESEQSVKNFVKDYQVDYRIGWATSDVKLTLMQGRDAIPQSFVISRGGRIVRRFVGFNSKATPPQMKLAIEEALKT